LLSRWFGIAAIFCGQHDKFVIRSSYTSDVSILHANATRNRTLKKKVNREVNKKLYIIIADYKKLHRNNQNNDKEKEEYCPFIKY